MTILPAASFDVLKCVAEAWTLTPVGLSPTVQASLRWTHTFQDK
jgi:hypothetical protein